MRKKKKVLICSILFLMIIIVGIVFFVLNNTIERQVPFSLFYGSYSDMSDKEIREVFQSRSQEYIESGFCEDAELDSNYVVHYKFTSGQLDDAIKDGNDFLNDETIQPFNILGISYSEDYKNMKIETTSTWFEGRKNSPAYIFVDADIQMLLFLQIYDGKDTYENIKVEVEYILSDTNETIKEMHDCYE